MAISRRQFLKRTLAAGAMVGAGGMMNLLTPRGAFAYYQSPTTIPLFGTSLRGAADIWVAASDSSPAPITGVKHYTIGISQFTDPGVCPALGTTTLRGFTQANFVQGDSSHLGGIIIGQKGVPIQITFRNNLPTTGMHIIPNDITIPGAKQSNRTAVHFHGGLVPWISDGGPFDWWDPSGAKGESFLNNVILNPTARINEAEYYYPLNQSARFGWYHDHAHGITRINAYAGMASGLLIRDGFELNLVNQGLPNYLEAGGNEIPLIIQDKTFVDANPISPNNINLLDPTWAAVVDPAAQTSGSLWYPHVYERNRWRISGNFKGGSAKNPAAPDPSVVPEFFGDTMLVNGTTFPKATVQARRYRLRILNACNARFLNLQLYIADSTAPNANGITLDPLGNPTNDPALCDPNDPGNSANVLQIGTEGGFLPYPVKVPTNLPFNPVTFSGSLIVAPAERPDILIDFKQYAGKSIILYNDAPAPFPAGDPRYDYFPGWNVKGNPVNAATPAGFGPNSRILMRFDVVAATGDADPTLEITTATNLQPGNDTLFFPYTSGQPVIIDPPPGIAVRRLTLNESFDAYGRLEQLLGTNIAPKGNSNFGRLYLDPATETPIAGATEVWEIYNLSADTHPMHFHLVNVQVLNRQTFQNFNGTATFKAAPTPPAPNEIGWKETVMMHPGTVTRVIMKFDLTGAAITTAAGQTIPTPASLRTTGNEFVWHCHILEHEEHDMMRPLVVI